RLTSHVAGHAAQGNATVHGAEVEPGIHVFDADAAVVRRDPKIGLAWDPYVVTHRPRLTASSRRTIGAYVTVLGQDVDSRGDRPCIVHVLAVGLDLGDDADLGPIPPVDADAAILQAVDVERLRRRKSLLSYLAEPLAVVGAAIAV